MDKVLFPDVDAARQKNLEGQRGVSRGADGLLRDLLNLREQDINEVSIAHALSNICRFCGNTRRFYSVAEHSLLVERLVRAKTKDPRILLGALTHDCSESFVGDVISPVKDLIGRRWDEIEDTVHEAIRRHFGIDGDHQTSDIIVWDSDAEARHMEERALFPGKTPLPTDLPIRCYNPKKARRLFLRRLGKLKKQCEDLAEEERRQPRLPL